MLSVFCLDSGCYCFTPPSFHVSAKPFVIAVKGPSRERQSPPEHGLHVLGSDRLRHGYPQQTGTARHPAPSLPWSRGKTRLCSLLFHPVQLHAVQRVVAAVECVGGGEATRAKSHYTPQTNNAQIR